MCTCFCPLTMIPKPRHNFRFSTNMSTALQVICNEWNTLVSCSGLLNHYVSAWFRHYWYYKQTKRPYHDLWNAKTQNRVSALIVLSASQRKTGPVSNPVPVCSMPSIDEMSVLVDCEVSNALTVDGSKNEDIHDTIESCCIDKDIGLDASLSLK